MKKKASVLFALILTVVFSLASFVAITPNKDEEEIVVFATGIGQTFGERGSENLYFLSGECSEDCLCKKDSETVRETLAEKGLNTEQDRIRHMEDVFEDSALLEF